MSPHPKVPAWEVAPSYQSPAQHPCPVLSSPCSLHDVPVLCEGGTYSVHEGRWGGKSAGAQGSGSLLLTSQGSERVGDLPSQQGCRAHTVRLESAFAFYLSKLPPSIPQVLTVPRVSPGVGANPSWVPSSPFCYCQWSNISADRKSGPALESSFPSLNPH